MGFITGFPPFQCLLLASQRTSRLYFTQEPRGIVEYEGLSSLAQMVATSRTLTKMNLKGSKFAERFKSNKRLLNLQKGLKQQQNKNDSS